MVHLACHKSRNWVMYNKNRHVSVSPNLVIGWNHHISKKSTYAVFFYIWQFQLKVLSWHMTHSKFLKNLMSIKEKNQLRILLSESQIYSLGWWVTALQDFLSVVYFKYHDHWVFSRYCGMAWCGRNDKCVIFVE